MLAVFGWLVLVVFGIQATLAWFMILLNHGGSYTIGGAINSLVTRIAVIVVGALIACYWYWLYTISPLTINTIG